MFALFSLLIIVMLSIVVVRIGSIALELTGLSPEIASFQAQSAFSGVGFTTNESEAIVTHPLRRRIVRVLILLGSAGITTSVATLVLAFVGESGKDVLIRAEVLIFGLAIIFLFARSKYVYSLMKKAITRTLKKYTKLRIYDYEQMFGLSEGYSISKITIKDNSWLRDKRLKDLHLELKKILVLAIYRQEDKGKKLIGAPHGETLIKAGDELICYAREEILNQLLSKKMRAGDNEKETSG